MAAPLTAAVPAARPVRSPRKRSSPSAAQRFPGPLSLLGDGSPRPEAGREEQEQREPGRPEQRQRVGGSVAEDKAWRGGAWQAGLRAAGCWPAGGEARLGHSVAWVRLEGYWRKAPLLLVEISAVRATHHDCAVEVRDPTGSMGAVVHREVVDSRAADLAEGAVLLLTNVSCFCARDSYYLNIVPACLAAVFPASTPAPPELPEGFAGLQCYSRVPTRRKRPSSAKKNKQPPRPAAPVAAAQVEAMRRALQRIQQLPVVARAAPLPPPPLPPPVSSSSSSLGWGDEDDALLLEYARMTESAMAKASPAAVPVPAPVVAGAGAGGVVAAARPWGDEEDAMLLELDLDSPAMSANKTVN